MTLCLEHPSFQEYGCCCGDDGGDDGDDDGGGGGGEDVDDSCESNVMPWMAAAAEVRKAASCTWLVLESPW